MDHAPTPYGVLQDEVELDSPSHFHTAFPARDRPQCIPITTKQKLYVVGMQGVGAGLVNVVINLVVAYVMYRHIPDNTIAFAGSLTCVVSDVIVTSFLIPCLTGIIGTALIRNDLRVGKLISPIDCRYLAHPIFKQIPTGQSWSDVIKRSILFGFIGIVLFAPITLLIIYLSSGSSGMRAVWPYVAFKGYWSGLVAMVLSPVIAFIAIASLRPSTYVSSSMGYGDVEYADTNADAFVATEDEDDTQHAGPHPGDAPHETTVRARASFVVT